MELLMEIRVKTLGEYVCGSEKLTVVMIPFEAEATGEFFHGKTIGQCVDTQKIVPGKPGVLSARYMLEGKDYKGKECKVFIENNGSDWSHLIPQIVTDSENLKFLENENIYDTVELIPGGVLIKVYR